MTSQSSALESRLILRARSQRDQVAFSRLVAMHQSNVRGFLHRLCHNYALAGDLAQDTFLLAYRKLASFQGHGSFDGWLFCNNGAAIFLRVPG